MMYELTMKGIGGSSEAHRVYFSTANKDKDPKKMTTESGYSNPNSDMDTQEELSLSALGNSLRQIDRNMSRIKSLDVVQQLQAGLF